MRDLTPDRFHMACERQAAADAEARRAHRPPDSALDPVDVRFLEIESKARALVAERDRLQERVQALHIALADERKASNEAIVAWSDEALAEHAAKRRATYLAALLFCALVWREGWRVWLWVRGWL